MSANQPQTPPDAPTPPRTYFAFEAYTAAIQEAFVTRVREESEAFVTSVLPPENVQRFHHGGGWRHPGNDDVQDSGMVEHIAEHETPLENVVRHDLAMIDRSVEVLSRQMQKQFMQMLFGTVGKAAESVGNSIDASGLSPLELFTAGLEAVEVSANPDFTVRWPQFVGGGDMPGRVEAALQAASKEDLARIEAIKATKANAAIERERERQARFKRYGA